MYTIFLHYVLLSHFIVAVFYGLKTYHQKEAWSLLCTMVWVDGCAHIIAGVQPMWWVYAMGFIDTSFFILFVIDADLFVHGEPGEQKLWNTLKGWFYLSLAEFFDWVYYYNPNEFVLERFEDYAIRGFCNSYYGYFPLKPTTWEEIEKRFGFQVKSLDFSDSTDYSLEQS